MPLQRLLHEAQRRGLVARPSDVAFQYLTLVIDSAPEIVGLAVYLHKHLIEVPTPMTKPAHRAHPLATNVGGEHRAESVPPEADRLMAKIDAALEQQVLDVPQRQRKPDVHHDNKTDHF